MDDAVARLGDVRAWGRGAWAVFLVGWAAAAVVVANLLPAAFSVVPTAGAVVLLASFGYRWGLSLVLGAPVLVGGLAVQAFVVAVAPAARAVPWSVMGVLLASASSAFVVFMAADDIAGRLPASLVGERTVMRIGGDRFFARLPEHNEFIAAIAAGEFAPAEAREQALQWARQARAEESRGGFWQTAYRAEAEWFESLADAASRPGDEEAARRTNDLAKAAQEARNECVRRARVLDPRFFGIKRRTS